ncbi:garvicin Q family class II bacteriocin [Leuconostoc gelidum subsp. aenigmaticum]|uniref:garvicin Q family class II bacteriocin n=1 Tax=Leuconostoc gelidum TaxID=1244 RepID=UPI001CC52AB6|nr:garvicin Q family class II bacteriocin [Leuconostoc gelidum]MBZ6003909.1 garvicin Q family class II bacteriocin [Leuconostoc gelidum subsp. aenigmaticum]
MKALQEVEAMNDTQLAQVMGGSGEPLFYGANGYASRDSKGRWQYTVTKSPLQAAGGVVVNGWASAAAGGFGGIGFRR